MPESLARTSSETAVSATADPCLRAFRYMLLARVLDDKLASLYRAGKIHGGVFLGRGQEALSAAIGVHLAKRDVFAPLIRDLAGRLAFGESALDVLRTFLGSVLGPMRGRDGNVHRGRPAEGLLPMISHLGAMISVTNGILFARRLRGEQGAVGVASVGDGATSTGAFHEGLNQAAVERLPLVLVVANNQYAYSTPIARQFACRDLADKAPGYGVAAHRVDGTDLFACLDVLGQAIACARAGAGPQFVEARLLRLCGHGEHDDGSYVDPVLRESPEGRDCLEVAQSQILERGWVPASVLEGWRVAAVRQVDEAVAKCQREPGPDPFAERWEAIATRTLVEGPAPEVEAR